MLMGGLKIQCPCCGKMVDSLAFWRKLGEVYLHICQECKERTLTEEELLRVGFAYGRQRTLDQAQKAIRKCAAPEIGIPLCDLPEEDEDEDEE